MLAWTDGYTSPPRLFPVFTKQLIVRKAFYVIVCHVTEDVGFSACYEMSFMRSYTVSGLLPDTTYDLCH